MSAPLEPKYFCHWDYVSGPNRGSAAPRTMVWICEYPYRTVRLDGPCEDCECALATMRTLGAPGIGKEERAQRETAMSAEARSAKLAPRVLPFKDNK